MTSKRVSEMTGAEVREMAVPPRAVTYWDAQSQYRGSYDDPTGRGKLVRDKIPEVIRRKGLEPIVYVASAEEYGARLRDKLREEVDEFLSSDNDPGELADILEVVYALAGEAALDPQQLEKLRAEKASERGAFAHRIIWSGNQPEPAVELAKADREAGH